MYSLILQYGHQQDAVEQPGDGGDLLFLLAGDSPNNVRNTVEQPVRNKDGGAGNELGERMLVSAHGLDDGAKPEVVIQVSGEDAKDFELEPLAFERDEDDADGEDDPRRQRVNVNTADKDGGVGEEKGESGDDLRVVAQRVPHHREGNDEHENEIESL